MQDARYPYISFKQLGQGSLSCEMGESECSPEAVTSTGYLQQLLSDAPIDAPPTDFHSRRQLSPQSSVLGPNPSYPLDQEAALEACGS